MGRRREEVEKKRKLGIPFLGRVPAAKVTDSPLACLSLSLSILCMCVCCCPFVSILFLPFPIQSGKKCRTRAEKGARQRENDPIFLFASKRIWLVCWGGLEQSKDWTSFSIFQACLMTGRRADSSYYTAISPAFAFGNVWSDTL